MRLFLVRHGETAWNREERFQGQRDIPLNETGLRQAALTAERFRGFPLEAVFASPLSRAHVTGQRIFDAAQCGTFVVEPGFAEIGHGLWEGMTLREVGRDHAPLLERWNVSPERVTMPGGESLAEVQRRALLALEHTALRHGGDTLLATHGAVLKTLICHFLGMPLSCFWRLKVPNCSVSCVEFADGLPQVALLSDVSHLGEGFGAVVPRGL